MRSKISLRHFLFLFVIALFGSALSLRAQSASDNYQLRPMDLVRIQVFQEIDLDREVRVSRNHTITLPLIGTVKLHGKTLREAERLITAAYQKDFLVNPQINVTVLEYSPRVINVLGAVNTPGPVAIPPESDLTVLEAITRAGGFSRIANRNKIVVTRTTPEGEAQNFVINGDELMRGGSDSRWSLVAGDVVYIPESIL